MPPLPPLVDRLVSASEVAAAEAAAGAWPRLTIDAATLADLALIGVGAFSPLEGFMGAADHASVCERMRLADGRLWPLPITLAADEAAALAAKDAGRALLVGPDGTAHGEIEVQEAYRLDRAAEARQLFGTDDAAHPGVAAIAARPGWNVAGPIRYYGRAPKPCPAQHLPPAEVRAEIVARGWRAVAGCQPSDLIDRAEEYLQKVALELVDGLLLHPLVGGTETGVPAAVRMRGYERLIAAYFPPNRVILAALPAGARHAGPREALFHALVRRNYGCTHVVVGPDHALGDRGNGVACDHPLTDALAAELGVTVLRFEASFYCRDCGTAASTKTCPHPLSSRLSPSAAKVRELLSDGHLPPPEITRPEVAAVLVAALREPGATHTPAATVEPPPEAPIARTIWLTGLPAAGKSTIARALADAMRARGRQVEVLDDDEVQGALTTDFGASKADSVADTRRVGFVAGVLNRNGIDAIVATIAPFAEGRVAACRFATEIVVVYVNCPIEVCANRDPKGLYRRAFTGETTGLAGVDAPYEPPDAPDLELRTDLEDVQACVDRLLALIGV